MSFAATLALIASYRNGLSALKPNADTSLGARVAMWGGREAASLILASIVAGLATTPYAAFHFHRSSPYGLIANLLAMPVVSGLVMPAGIVGLLAMPFGFDGPCWTLMGIGIAWMDKVSLWVAGLPGAVGRVPAFGTGPLLLGTAGLLLICLLRTRLRHLGTVAALASIVWVASLRPPDVYVSPDGRAVAVRDPGGELAVSKLSRDSFAVREWLAADADARTVDDKSLDEGKSCDAQGCVLPLPDGTLVAHAQSLASLVDDCKKAALVVTARAGLIDCKALLIDRERLRNGGALALRWSGTDFSVIETRPAAQRRPWTGNPEPAAPAPNPRAPVRDATPAPADLEADD
jgi:competence protein ComEC